MLKQLAFIKSKHALTIGFGALLVLIVVATLLGISRIYAINQRIEALVYEQNFKSELLATLLTVTRERQQLTLRLFAVKDPAERDAAYRKFQGLVGQMFGTLDRLEDMELTGSERTAVNEALDAATRSQEVRERVVALVMKNDVPAATDLFLQQGLPAQDRFQESLNRLIDSKRAATLEAVSQAGQAMREALLLVAVIGVLVLIFGAFVASQVIRQVVRSEDALYREKELAEVTLHSIGDGVITADAEGRIDYMNPLRSNTPAGRARMPGASRWIPSIVWSTSKPESRCRIRLAMRPMRAARAASRSGCSDAVATRARFVTRPRRYTTPTASGSAGWWCSTT